MPAGSISSHGPPSYSRFFTLSILLIFSIFLRPVSAGPRNYTIDDQLGDEITSHIPTYAPTFAWATQDCQGCGVDPDKNQLFDGTATSATFMPDKNISSNTVDFDFNGTAIYIFFTLFYNEGNGITVNTECNFTVDSEPAVFFNHTGDPTKPANQVRDYKALVFSRTGLTLESHHMKISMSDVSYHVFLSFDYAMYTNEDVDTTVASLSSTSTSSTPGSAPASIQTTGNNLASTQTTGSTSSGSSSVSPGIIAGGVIGGIAVLAGFLILFYFYRRDRKRYQPPDSPGSTVPRPFTAIVLSKRSGDRRTRLPASAAAPTNHPRATSRENSQNRRAHTTPTPNPHLHIRPSMETSTSSSPPTQSSGSVGSSSRSGSRSVEHRIQMASQRMRSLRAEMASVSGRTASSSRSSGSRTSSSRATEELAEEVKQLRQEIQALKQLQRQQAQTQQLHSAVDFGPPPLYTDEV